jgi:predicted naringenin-chalcone synthase
MNHASGILSIGTAVPPHTLRQRELGEHIAAALPQGEKTLIQFTKKLYRSGGIDSRHTVLPDFPAPSARGRFLPDHPRPFRGPTTRRRNDLYKQYAPALAVAAARNAILDREKISASSITHLIVASCTGFFAPGIDFAIIKALGLSDSVSRTQIGFMGCFAALPALRMADALCRSGNRDTRVLVVCVELCSLHYRHSLDRSVIVANSLFADGASAAVVAPIPRSPRRSPTQRPLYRLRSFTSAIIPASDSAMSWAIGNNGFVMGLSSAVPEIIGNAIQPMVKRSCRDAGIDESDIRAYAVHPGGRAILDAIASRLALASTDLDASREVLRRYGNMSSATLLFVLKELVKRPMIGLTFAAAFGPGLVAETAIIERCS